MFVSAAESRKNQGRAEKTKEEEQRDVEGGGETLRGLMAVLLLEGLIRVLDRT